MSQYTRIFLHFLHALTEDRRRVRTFLFGTRLTNITARCATVIRMRRWICAQTSSRIGPAARASVMRSMNSTANWSRRVLGQGAVVLLITDGLERDEVKGLSEAMERLHKSCRRLVWLSRCCALERLRSAGARRQGDVAAC